MVVSGGWWSEGTWWGGNVGIGGRMGASGGRHGGYRSDSVPGGIGGGPGNGGGNSRFVVTPPLRGEGLWVSIVERRSGGGISIASVMCDPFFIVMVSDVKLATVHKNVVLSGSGWRYCS